MLNSIRDIEQWSRYHAIGIILAFITYLNIGKLWILPVVSLISFGYLIIVKRSLILTDEFKVSRANLVTLSRHDLILLTVIISSQLSLFTIGVITAIVACMDILDGYYARKDNNATIVGEYLDKEVDAIFVLFMTVMIYHYELLPSWILVIGILRYGYVLLLPYLKSNEKKEYRSKYGRIIAVILMVGLIGCFILRYQFYQFIMMGISLLVIGSFIHSLIHWIKKPVIEDEWREKG